MTRSDAGNKTELLRGTLDMLVLKTLTQQPMHGYAIARHLARVSQDVLTVEQGSLYPALERLQAGGWVTSQWKETPTGRRARYYTITASGRKRLGADVSTFEQVLHAIQRVMRPA